MAGAVRVQIQNLDKLIKATGNDKVLKQAAMHALQRIGELGVRAAQAKAPVGPTKQTRARLTYKLNSGTTPKWVVIKTDATATPRNPGARKGKTKYPYPYPRRVEFDPKGKHKDWLRNAIRAARPAIERSLDAAARELEMHWRT